MIPDAVGDDFPEESTEGHGSLPAIRSRLDDLLDLETARMAALDDQDLAARARWSGAWVDVGFRVGRWSSHLREHTIQVDKTLVMIGWTPREVDRLSGVILGAWGRLEATVFGLPGRRWIATVPMVGPPRPSSTRSRPGSPRWHLPSSHRPATEPVGLGRTPYNQSDDAAIRA